MTKIVKNLNGSYSMMVDDVTVSENLKVIFDKRKGCGDIKLPENEYGKKWLSESAFKNGADSVELKPGKISSGEKKSSNQSGVPGIDKSLISYMTDDEKFTYNQILENCKKRKADETRLKIEKQKEELLKRIAEYEKILAQYETSDEKEETGV